MGTHFISLVLLCVSFLSSASASAGQFVGACDSRGAGRDKCLEWVTSSLRTLGCTVTASTAASACKLHPWGSDFIKSWVCEAGSPDCQVWPDREKKCPAGTVHVFRVGWDACHQAPGAPVYTGECVRQNPTQAFRLSDCAKLDSHCASLGGETEKISVQDCTVTCRFRDMRIQREGKSCEEIQARCERGNSPQGVQGHLDSCVLKAR